MNLLRHRRLAVVDVGPLMLAVQDFQGWRFQITWEGRVTFKLVFPR